MSDRKFFWFVVSASGAFIVVANILDFGAVARMGIMIAPIAYLWRQQKKS